MKTVTRRITVAILSGAIASGAAHAQSSDESDDTAQLQAKGVQAMRSKVYTEAVKDFEAAYKVTHKPLLFGMMAKAHLALGACGAAIDDARKFAAKAAPADLDSAQQVLAEMLDKCVQTTIESEPTGAELLIDGKPSETTHVTPWTGYILAGDHTITVKNKSHEQHRELHVPEGRHVPLKLSILLNAPARSSEPSPPLVSAAPPPELIPANPRVAAPNEQPTPPILDSKQPSRAAAAKPTAQPSPATSANQPGVTAQAHPQVDPNAVAVAHRSNRHSYAPPIASDVLFGVAGVAAVVAIAEGIETNKCPSNVSNPVYFSSASDCLSSHSKAANISWIVAGAGAAIGGGVWIVTAMSDGDTRGVAVAGRF